MSVPNPNIDPITGQLEQLRHALTTEQHTAETLNGAVRVACSADGLIQHCHVAESLEYSSIGDVVATVVRLQHEATAAARSALAEASDRLQNDPRIRQEIDARTVTLTTPPREPVLGQETPCPDGCDDDAYFANQSFLHNPIDK